MGPSQNLILIIDRKLKFTVKNLRLRDAKAVSKILIVGVLIVVIVIAGVAGYILTKPSAGPKTTVKDTLIMGTTDSVETCLDPARAYDYFGWEIVQSLGCPLVEYKAGATGAASDFIPALATSWSSSDDGLQWTFNLRQGVKYDDGTKPVELVGVNFDTQVKGVTLVHKALSQI